MIKRVVVLSAVLLVALAPSARAQRSRGDSRPIEFGIDGGLAFGLDNPKVTALVIPTPVFRVGFLMTGKVALEPRLQLASVHSGGQTATAYGIEIGVLYSPNGDRVGNGLYGRPFIGISGASISGGGSNSNGHAGAGIGLKLPFADRRMATRLEANYSHEFGTPSSNTIGLLFGLSWFTR
jgi:hypothetical protein